MNVTWQFEDSPEIIKEINLLSNMKKKISCFSDENNKAMTFQST
jgi:hypothetical protein